MDVAALAHLLDPVRGVQGVALLVALFWIFPLLRAGWRILRESAGQRPAELRRLLLGVLVGCIGWAFVGTVLVAAALAQLFPQILMWVAPWVCDGVTVQVTPAGVHCLRPDATVVDITYRAIPLAGLALGGLLMTMFLWSRKPGRSEARARTHRRAPETIVVQAPALRAPLNAVRRSYMEQLARALAAVARQRQSPVAWRKARQQAEAGGGLRVGPARDNRHATASVADRLRALQALRARKLISAAEYDARRAEILSRL